MPYSRSFAGTPYRCFRGLLILVAVLALAAPAVASVEQAQDRLFRLIGELRQRFPSLKDRTEYGIGTLGEGETEIYIERFDAGRTYLVVAVGCESAKDIDVGILDESGKTMVADTDADAAAAVVFEPKVTGRYVVGVNMARTTAGDAAHFGYQVFYADDGR